MIGGWRRKIGDWPSVISFAAACIESLYAYCLLTYHTLVTLLTLLKLLQTSNLLYYITLDEPIFTPQPNAKYTHKTSVFLLEKRRYGRGAVDPVHAYLAPVAHPWCSPDASRASISGIQWPKQPSHEVNYVPFQTLSFPMLCKNNGIIVFPSENSHFLVVTSSLCHPTSASLRSNIAY